MYSMLNNNEVIGEGDNVKMFMDGIPVQHTEPETQDRQQYNSVSVGDQLTVPLSRCKQFV